MDEAGPREHTEMSKMRASFAVGTGRSGTSLMMRLMDRENGVDAFHELHPLNETFHRYCKWYGLPVDDAGFIHQKKQEIQPSAENGRLFFESSAYLSLSLETLARYFDIRVVLLVRHPVDVINSYLKKGWYNHPTLVDDPSLAAGFQPTPEFHHFLGRILPKGDALAHWQNMGRPGKLAWYWAALNTEVLNTFQQLGPDICRLQKLEDLDYAAYRELAAFLGAVGTLAADEAQHIIESRPNGFTNLPTIADWSATDRAEVLHHIRPLADELGYDISAVGGDNHG
jgi:hypothetical protein